MRSNSDLRPGSGTHLTVPAGGGGGGGAAAGNQPRLSTVSAISGFGSMANGLDDGQRRLPTRTRVLYCGSIMSCVVGMSLTVAGSLCIFIFLGSRAGGRTEWSYRLQLYIGLVLIALGICLLVFGTVLCCCVSPTFGNASTVSRLTMGRGGGGRDRGHCKRSRSASGDDNSRMMLST